MQRTIPALVVVPVVPKIPTVPTVAIAHPRSVVIKRAVHRIVRTRIFRRPERVVREVLIDEFKRLGEVQRPGEVGKLVHRVDVVQRYPPREGRVAPMKQPVAADQIMHHHFGRHGVAI